MTALDDAAEVQGRLAEAIAFADEGFLGAAQRSFSRVTRSFARHARRTAEREDHRRLRIQLEIAQTYLDRRDAAGFTRAARRLSDANRRHERQEHRLHAPVGADL